MGRGLEEPVWARLPWGETRIWLRSVPVARSTDPAPWLVRPPARADVEFLPSPGTVAGASRPPSFLFQAASGPPGPAGEGKAPDRQPLMVVADCSTSLSLQTRG